MNTAIVAGLSFLLFRHLTDWSTFRLALAVAIASILGDVAMAVSMQAVAPTRVDIGPGEKAFVADTPYEKARVIADFDASGRGLVSIRGESWRAVRATGSDEALTEGTRVRVLERKGLTLVVSATLR